MPIVTFATLKGGTGKTTSSIYLATALSTVFKQENVTVNDLDPQGSASKWSAFAEDDGHPLPFNVQPANVHTLSRLKSSSDVWIINDCPPGAGALFDAAVDVADLVIVPLEPAGIEAEQMWTTVDFVKDRDIRVRVLLASVNRATKSAKALISELDSEEVDRFETIIPRREAIKNSWSQLPVELHGYENVTQEIIDMLGLDLAPASN